MTDDGTLYVMKSFTQKEAAKIVGLKESTLQAWVRDGLVEASIAAAQGRGSLRRYSPTDLVHIALIRILSQRTINRELMVSLNRYLSTPDPDGKRPKEAWMDVDRIPEDLLELIILEENRWRIHRGFKRTRKKGDVILAEASALNIIQDNESVLVINLEKVKERIREAMM